MIHLTVNGSTHVYQGDPEKTLLTWLRNEQHICSAKDGCSGQGSCGACTVEINGNARLACRTKMSDLQGAAVLTTEGLPEHFKLIIGRAFANYGAVQCGFCSPGFIMRSKVLYSRNPRPGRDEIVRAIHPNICRCTGYIKIIEAIEKALSELNGNTSTPPASPAVIGGSYPKYQAFETALGVRPFVDDLNFPDMLHGVLVFSEHPRAKILNINTEKAKLAEGVIAVFTANDIPGQQNSGLIFTDWPMMIAEGQICHCISDVLALVVAQTEEQARNASQLTQVEYEVLPSVTNMHEAMSDESVQVHSGRSNVLESCNIRLGNPDDAFAAAAYRTGGVFETQRIEHAFLETETAVALPFDDGLHLFSQGQGVYVDQRQIALLLNLPKEKIKVTQVQNGGGFGGKEDLTVQPHAALAALLLKKAVRVHLNREESIRMHPKRHPVWMNIELGCDAEGRLTAIRLNARGDTGAYASVGTKVMERVVGHATGGYAIPNVDVRADTIYTNNIPSGAMRGFGVPQVVFALESCIDELCQLGGFDRWELRYLNALEEGSRTATGQKLQGVGLKQTLWAVKDLFRAARYAGIACGIKNTGVGNGMIDESAAKIVVLPEGRLLIQHGWTEMGQSVHSVAQQVVSHETGIDPALIDVEVSTEAGIPTGMTTSSRASSLLGNALIDACKAFRNDLQSLSLKQLQGRVYKGKYVCDFTCKPGAEVEEPIIHFAYGYATQVVILNEEGRVSEVIAAHDAGKILNRTFFEGQIEGAIHMGLGFALSEDLPMQNGFPLSFNYKDLGVLRASEMPRVEVIGIEVPDAYGPYGAKGIGEIGMVPTAAAVANALRSFDGIQRFKLPLKRKNTKN